MKESLINYLEIYLEQHKSEWFPSAQLTDERKWFRKNGKRYTSQTVGRKLRLAEEQKRIAVKNDPSSVSILYKYLPLDRRDSYIPTSARLPGQENQLFR
jgi:hypothetical protein